MDFQLHHHQMNNVNASRESF